MIKSFRTRLFVLFAGLAGGALIVSLVAVSLATNSQSERTITRELEVSERVLEELLDVRGNQLLQAAQVLSDDFGFREAVSSNDEQTIISALVNHGERIGTDLMVLQTPTAEEIAATHALESLPSLETLVQMSGASGLLRIDERIYQLVTVPVRAPDLIAWATFGFVVDDDLTQLLQQLTKADITFMDFNQRVVFASSLSAEQQQRLRASELTLPGFERWLNEEHLAARQVSLQQHRLGYLTAANALSIIVSTDRDAATAEFRLLRQQFVGIGAAMLLMALVLAGVTARKINQPLARLSAAALRLQQGDYQQPVALQRNDEFGQLGDTFDAMQAAVAERESHIRYQVEHDLLTDLPNRLSFQQHLNGLLDRHQPGILLLLNLLRFRELNDRLGQRIGDHILQLVATRLRQQVPKDWWLARLAGDEFVLIGEQKSIRAVQLLLNDIRLAMEQPLLLDGSHYLCEFRAGYLEFPLAGTDVDSLVRRAQICTAKAKSEKQFAVLYQEGMDEYHMRRLQILQKLPDAVRNRKMQLHFQPKIACIDAEVVGAEALIRWRDEELGVVRPDEFIPLAEQSGEINRITRFVIESALDQLQLWHEQGQRLIMAINLSALDLQWHELSAYIALQIRERGLAPNTITFEVTESAVMIDPDQAIAVLSAIRALGSRISIDDYGTGYASLGQLKRLPVDELKLDRSFIEHLPNSPADQTIVRSTLALAHEMGLTTVAEGVEDEAAWRVLQQLGCDTMQGFYFSRPLAASEFDKWLHNYAQQLRRGD